MVSDTQFEQEDVKTRKIADIVVPDKVIETNLKEVLPEKVEDPDEPPPDMEPLDFDTDLDMSTANMAPTVAVNVSINASGLSSGDGEYLPIVKVAPIYPSQQIRYTCSLIPIFDCRPKPMKIVVMSLNVTG